VSDRITIKSRLLSDRQKAVIETIRLRLTQEQSLAYLKEIGYNIGPATLYREKRKVEALKLKRLYHIAQIGFQDQHLERIDIYEMGFKMMWQNVLRERDPFIQNSMIKDILLLQPYLSAYYEATKLVIEKQPEYEEFLDKQLQQQSKEEKITESIPRLNDDEDSINYDDDDDESFKEYDPNRKF
jgi:hypothetical protein